MSSDPIPDGMSHAVPVDPALQITTSPVGGSPVVTRQPPEQWYQRRTPCGPGTPIVPPLTIEQIFSIESSVPFTTYALDLLFVPPHAGVVVYEPVRNTRKSGNGMRHDARKDTRDSSTQLTVRPKIDMCTRVGDRKVVLQLTLSTGHVVRSIPFSVKNRHTQPNNYRSDVTSVLKQLEWCPIAQTCHICFANRRSGGHLSTCALYALLPKRRRY
jgi:hypothetical protein